MSQSVMQLKNVSKTIKNKQIIKGLDFEIYSGEVFGFLGPNGAGKTTTIRMMVGLMDMTNGDVIIQGHSVNKDFKSYSPRRRNCRKSGNVSFHEWSEKLIALFPYDSRNYRRTNTGGHSPGWT